MSEKQQNPIIKRLSSSLSQCYDKPEDRNIEVEEIYSSLYDQKYAILSNKPYNSFNQ